MDGPRSGKRRAAGRPRRFRLRRPLSLAGIGRNAFAASLIAVALALVVKGLRCAPDCGAARGLPAGMLRRMNSSEIVDLLGQPPADRRLAWTAASRLGGRRMPLRPISAISDIPTASRFRDVQENQQGIRVGRAAKGGRS